MSRSFHCSVESSLTVQQINDAYSSLDFWLARMSETGGSTEMESFDVTPDGTVRTVVAQDVGGAVLPGPFKRLYPGGFRIVQSQSWAIEHGEKFCGDVRFEARGARGSGTSRLVLARAPDAEQITCTGTTQFKVPMVGGTLETLFSGQMVDQMPELLRFIATWVDEHD